jgi:hypothetical protein
MSDTTRLAEPLSTLDQLDEAVRAPQRIARAALSAEVEPTTLTRDSVPAARPPRGARCGAAAVDLQLPLGVHMAGYSLMSKKGRQERWPLVARAMVLEDDAGHVIAFAVIDMMSASRYLHERVAAITRQGSSGLDVHQIVLIGTHTHSAPGGFYGNSLYDTMAQGGFRGFQPEVANTAAQAIADAIEEAWRTARPARVGVHVERLWGVSRNRSLPPFTKNPVARDWNDNPERPGHGGQQYSSQQRAIDPRVVVLTAYDEAGARIGLFATFACHNTALGMPRRGEVPYYAPDWTGFAASLVEADTTRGAPFALVGLSGAGDVTPLPPSPDDKAIHYDGPREQGEALARFVGGRVAEAILRASARPPPQAPLSIQSWYEDWVTSPGSEVPGVSGTRIARWEFGASTLAGAEDGRSALYPGLAWEGMTGNRFPPDHPQHPKRPALGVFGALLRKLAGLNPSPSHALHVVKVGDHAFATVPGEPTVCAAYQIERAVLEATGARSASVIGYAGDFAGYFTTWEEFREQHYEGASTLYGSESVNHLAARLARLARGVPFQAPSRELAPFTFHEPDTLVDIPTHAPVPTRVAARLIEGPTASVGEASSFENEALASGGNRAGQRVTAWWAWPVEHAPDALLAHVELRASTGRVLERRPAQVTRLLEDSLFGREVRFWVAEFELATPPEGVSVVATATPAAPFRAPVVEVDLPAESAPAAAPHLAMAMVQPVRDTLTDEAEAPAPTEETEGVRPMDEADMEELVRETERDPVGVGRRLWRRIDASTSPTDAQAAELAQRMAREVQARRLQPTDAVQPFRAALRVERGPTLPPDFDFPGYDPKNIPIDPGDTRFQTTEDLFNYIVFTGGLYHLDLLPLDPVRRAEAYQHTRFTYPMTSPTPGSPVEVGLFSDFANGLPHARYIARQLAGLPYAIHLGDVYYAGRQSEFDEYVTAPLEPILGGTELFMLSGNHEMYSRGFTFHRFLDEKRARWPARQRQEGATFRLVSDKFQIVGVDTCWWKDGRIEPELRELVREWLREGREERMNILLTSQHGWDFGSRRVTQLLSNDLHGIVDEGLVDLWFWGNVHHGALYEPSRHGPFIASCIGHAGYPYYTLKREDAEGTAAKVRWAEYASRYYGFQDADGEPLRPDVGNNGWCKLRLHHDGTAELVYIDWRKDVRHTARVKRGPTGATFF